MAAYCVEAEVEVAPQRSVWQHHPLGESGGAAGVVDQCQFFGAVVVVIDVFGPEGVGIFLSEQFVKVLAGKRELLGARLHERIVGYVDDAFECRHFLGSDCLGHYVADKHQFRFAVIDYVVYLFGVEFMHDGHGHGAVSQRCEEGDGPVGAVSPADGNLVAAFHPAVFKEDVQLFYLAGHVVVLKCDALIVGKGIFIPVVYNAFLNI